jgi:hypothetical protein
MMPINAMHCRWNRWQLNACALENLISQICQICNQITLSINLKGLVKEMDDIFSATQAVNNLFLKRLLLDTRDNVIVMRCNI